MLISWDVFIHGGWVILVYLVYRISAHKQQLAAIGKFFSGVSYVCLQIRVDKENRQSTLAVEQIFAQLHAIHSPATWAQAKFEGKLQLWVSLEIVSIGGVISYIIRAPSNYRNVIESSFYARYPQAEIFEVQDYMEKFKHWDENSTWELWGTEFAHVTDYAYPIRTYRDFEHPAADESVIDPLNALYEALSKTAPYEMFAVQYIITPMADKEWNQHSKEVIAGWKGEKAPPKAPKISEILLKPLNILGEKTLFDLFKPHAPAAPKEDGSVPKVQRLTEGEKKILTGIENKASKLAYKTKIRLLHIAPKGRFDGSKRQAVVGSFKQLGMGGANGLKPDTAHTWTTTNYKLSEKLEKPYTDYLTMHKKHEILKGFVERSNWIGAEGMILSIEEIATLFHFPVAPKAGSTAPAVEAIDVKRGQPPTNLPVSE
jgi:hypothetical protein